MTPLQEATAEADRLRQAEALAKESLQSVVISGLPKWMRDAATECVGAQKEIADRKSDPELRNLKIGLESLCESAPALVESVLAGMDGRDFTGRDKGEKLKVIVSTPLATLLIEHGFLPRPRESRQYMRLDSREKFAPQDVHVDGLDEAAFAFASAYLDSARADVAMNAAIASNDREQVHARWAGL